MREIRDGLGAQAAVTAALLARRGVRCYDRPIEGPQGLFALYTGGRYDQEKLLAGLGSVYENEQLSFKPWPSCRGTHSFVEAALLLRAQYGFNAADIEYVEVEVSDVFSMLCEPFAQKSRPATANDAKFSVPFTTSVALSHGRLGLADFLPDALADPVTLDLAQRVRYSVRAPAGLQEALHGGLRVQLRDGRMLHWRIEQPLGDPKRPLNDAALEAKFIDCARYAPEPMDDAQACMAASRIAGLDGAPDLSALSL